MLPSRWSALARYGLLGHTLLGLGAGRAVADPCDDVEARSVSVVLGFELSPKGRVIGGVEGRQCLSDKTEAMMRLEFGGGPRLIFSARARPFETMENDGDAENLGLEAGLVLASQSRLDVHLAMTYGPHFVYAALQGRMPLTQTERPFHIALLGALSPIALRTQSTVVNGRPVSTATGYLRPDVIGETIAAHTREEQIIRDHFTSSAQHELSSVWTFLRLAAELAAVGAPRELVIAALDAADDEVRHAEMCARAAGGIRLAGLPDSAAYPRFLERSPAALAMLAREAWLEGCLNEGAAAEQARLGAGEARGEIATMLAAIAVDERRHAELSHAVLSWVSSIAPELSRERPIPGAPASTDEIDLSAYGVPTAAITTAAWQHAVTSATDG